MTTQIERTAAHEAGHVVAAHVLGGRLGLAWALEGHTLGGSMGEAHVSHPDPDLDAVIYLAGGVSAAFCAGQDYLFFDGARCIGWTPAQVRKVTAPNTSPLVKVTAPEPATDGEMQETIHRGRMNDIAQAWRCLRKASQSDAEAAERFDRAQHTAMRLVVEHLLTIRALASVLATEHVLTAEKVRAFLKRFGAEQPGAPS